MSEWKIGRTYTSTNGVTRWTEIREESESGSRYVCTARPEDVARIVAAVNRDAVIGQMDSLLQDALDDPGEYLELDAQAARLLGEA